MSVTFSSCNAGCHYGECHYAECHSAECHYAECHYAECHYAECYYAEPQDAEWRGTWIRTMVSVNNTGVDLIKHFWSKFTTHSFL